MQGKHILSTGEKFKSMFRQLSGVDNQNMDLGYLIKENLDVVEPGEKIEVCSIFERPFSLRVRVLRDIMYGSKGVELKLDKLENFRSGLSYKDLGILKGYKFSLYDHFNEEVSPPEVFFRERKIDNSVQLYLDTCTKKRTPHCVDGEYPFYYQEVPWDKRHHFFTVITHWM
jgi:hypothetical protein